MADLLPGAADVEEGDAEPRVLGLDSEAADEVLAALSADTARALLAAVHEEPSTPSELAERVDTSLQNTQYHLGKLLDADLVEERGTRYSEKGREMTVYGPTDRPLVLFAGDEDDGLRATLSRALGGVAVLAVASLLVQVALRGLPGQGGPAGDAATPEPQSFELDGTAAASDAVTSLPPGLLFALGGLFVLGVGVVWWYVGR